LTQNSVVHQRVMRDEAGGNLIMVNRMRAIEVVANCFANGELAVSIGAKELDVLGQTKQ